MTLLVFLNCNIHLKYKRKIHKTAKIQTNTSFSTTGIYIVIYNHYYM